MLLHILVRLLPKPKRFHFHLEWSALSIPLQRFPFCKQYLGYIWEFSYEIVAITTSRILTVVEATHPALELPVCLFPCWEGRVVQLLRWAECRWPQGTWWGPIFPSVGSRRASRRIDWGRWQNVWCQCRSGNRRGAEDQGLKRCWRSLLLFRPCPCRCVRSRGACLGQLQSKQEQNLLVNVTCRLQNRKQKSTALQKKIFPAAWDIFAKLYVADCNNKFHTIPPRIFFRKI